MCCACRLLIVTLTNMYTYTLMLKQYFQTQSTRSTHFCSVPSPYIPRLREFWRVFCLFCLFWIAKDQTNIYVLRFNGILQGSLDDHAYRVTQLDHWNHGSDMLVSGREHNAYHLWCPEHRVAKDSGIHLFPWACGAGQDFTKQGIIKYNQIYYINKD